MAIARDALALSNSLTHRWWLWSAAANNAVAPPLFLWLQDHIVGATVETTAKKTVEQKTFGPVVRCSLGSQQLANNCRTGFVQSESSVQPSFSEYYCMFQNQINRSFVLQYLRVSVPAHALYKADGSCPSHCCIAKAGASSRELHFLSPMVCSNISTQSWRTYAHATPSASRSK